MCDVTNTHPVCDVYSSLVIVSASFLCQPPPRFDTKDSAFPLTNLCKMISASLVSYPPIFGGMGIGNSVRTTLVLLVALAIISCTFDGVAVVPSCGTTCLIC